MIERYTTPEMGLLFAAPARLQRWLDVELLIVEGWAATGRFSRDVAARIRAAVPAVDDAFVAAVAEHEQVTRHDVAAFVDVLAQAVGPDDGRWIHYGVTASDIVDTALGVCLGQAAQLAVAAGRGLFEALAEAARRYRGFVMIGRTHGVHAEPVTLGARLALLALQVSRAIEGLAMASDAVRVGKVSGAVGTYAHVDAEVEAYVCRALGLRPIPSSQVVPRDVHAEFVFAMARATSAVEAVATQVRLGHQSEVGELHEGFGVGQKGSSSMPHKANPATAEQLCGLARVARASVAPALENVALWHERDLSHSSVERVVLADVASVTHYSLRTATRLVSDLVVDEDRLSANLAMSGDVVRSQGLLHRLIDAGRDRDEAYRLVQAALTASARNRTALRVESRNLGLPDDIVSAVFDVSALTGEADRAIDALDDCWAAS